MTTFRKMLMTCAIVAFALTTLVGCEEPGTITGTRQAWLDNEMSGESGEMQVELQPSPRLYLESWPDDQPELEYAVPPMRILSICQWGDYEVYQFDGGLNSDMATFQIVLENREGCFALLTIVDVQRTYYSEATVEVVPDMNWGGELLQVTMPREDGTTLTYVFKQDDAGSVFKAIRTGVMAF
jgi:hypothetical protein